MRVENPYADPNPEQTQTTTQMLQHQGGVAILDAPLRAAAIVAEYRPQFYEAFGLNRREIGSSTKAYAKAVSEHSLRRMLQRPYIYRSLPIAAQDIQYTFDVIEKTSPYRENILPDDTYKAQRDRVLNGNSAHVAYLANKGIEHVAKQTVNTFTQSEQEAINFTFKEQTKETKKTISGYLDVRYPYWRQLDLYTRTKPFMYGEKLPYDLRHWLQELTVGDQLIDSFSGASRATAEFGIKYLSELHTACKLAECPQEQWFPLSYANIRKLAIESQLPAKTGDGLGVTNDDPSREPIYVVNKAADGSWRVDFSDTDIGGHLAKIYDNHKYQGCQGAAEISYTDKTSSGQMERLQERTKKRAGGRKLDIDFIHGANAAQMFTLMTVARAEDVDRNLRTNHAVSLFP